MSEAGPGPQRETGECGGWLPRGGERSRSCCFCVRDVLGISMPATFRRDRCRTARYRASSFSFLFLCLFSSVWRVSAERQHGLTHAKREPPLFTRLTSSIACLESLLRRRRLLVHGFASISRAALENIDSFLCILFKRMQIKGAVHAICISL